MVAIFRDCDAVPTCPEDMDDEPLHDFAEFGDAARKLIETMAFILWVGHGPLAAVKTKWALLHGFSNAQNVLKVFSPG